MAKSKLNLLGKAVNGVSSLFQKDGKKGTVVGNALKKWKGFTWKKTF